MLKLVLNTFLAKIISAVCNLLVAILISKFLGAEGKGETSILLTNITVVVLFTNVFGGSTLAYLISKYDNKKIISIALTTSFIISIISCFVFYWITHSFWLSFNCALLSWLAALLSVFQNVLIGYNKVNYLSFSMLLQSISLLIIIMVGFFVYHSNVEIYTLGLFLSYIVSLSVTIYFYRISIAQKANKKEVVSLISLVKLGVQNQLSHVFYLFLMRISYYFLLLQSGKFAVGVFSNAIIIAEGIWLVASSMATVQYASILNVEKEKAIALTQFFCRASFAISLLAILVVFLIPNQLFIMVLGNDFYEVKSIVMYLSPGIILYNFSVILGHFFSGIGKFKINTFSNFIGVILACLVLTIYFSSFSIQHAVAFHLTAYVSISVVLIIAFMRDTHTQLFHLFYNSKDLLYLKGLLKKQS